MTLDKFLDASILSRDQTGRGELIMRRPAVLGNGKTMSIQRSDLHACDLRVPPVQEPVKRTFEIWRESHDAPESHIGEKWLLEYIESCGGIAAIGDTF